MSDPNAGDESSKERLSGLRKLKRLEGSTNEMINVFDQWNSRIVLRISPKLAVRSVVARAVVERQLDSLRAAATLGKSNLGHLSACFVRRACEEQIWLKYVSTLELKCANRLLLAMGFSDGMRGVEAFRKYAGSAQLEELGFPVQFINSASPSVIHQS